MRTHVDAIRTVNQPLDDIWKSFSSASINKERERRTAIVVENDDDGLESLSQHGRNLLHRQLSISLVSPISSEELLVLTGIRHR